MCYLNIWRGRECSTVSDAPEGSKKKSKWTDHWMCQWGRHWEPLSEQFCWSSNVGGTFTARVLREKERREIRDTSKEVTPRVLVYRGERNGDSLERKSGDNREGLFLNWDFFLKSTSTCLWGSPRKGNINDTEGRGRNCWRHILE